MIKCKDFNCPIEISNSLELLEKEEGPVFLELRCCKGARKDLGRPSKNLNRSKEIFIEQWSNL